MLDDKQIEGGEQNQPVCSCFGVSKHAIENQTKEGALSLDDLAASLGCGSKCGSCKPELSEMLQGY